MAETLHALQVRQLVPVRWIEPTAELLSGAWKSGPVANPSHHTLQGNVLPNLFFYQKCPPLASNSSVHPTQGLVHHEKLSYRLCSTLPQGLLYTSICSYLFLPLVFISRKLGCSSDVA